MVELQLYTGAPLLSVSSRGQFCINHLAALIYTQAFPRTIPTLPCFICTCPAVESCFPRVMRVRYAKSVGETCLIVVATMRHYRVRVTRSIRGGNIAIRKVASCERVRGEKQDSREASHKEHDGRRRWSMTEVQEEERSRATALADTCAL